MKEPTFFIAGAQRSGTTWLYHLLEEHPDVYMAKPVSPEPKFFLSEMLSQDDRRRYLDTWFADATDEVAVGEKSTSYMESSGVPERMKRLFPEARVVFLLRHPIERAISNYRFSRQHGLESESLEYAFGNETTRLAHDQFSQVSVHPFAYLRRGHYARDIARFLDVFQLHEIKVLQLEDLQDEPEKTLADLFAFLGVNAAVGSNAVNLTFNETPSDTLRVSRAMIDSLLQYYYPSNRALEELIGCDVSRWDRPSDSLLSMMDG